MSHTVNWELSINFGMIGRGKSLTYIHMDVTWTSVEPVNIAFFIAFNTFNCLKISHVHFVTKNENYTLVSEFSLRTNLLLFGWMISSAIEKCGIERTLHRRHTSAWRSWKMVPSSIARESSWSHTRPHDWTPRCSLSFCEYKDWLI